jgi:hypothetical protein
MPRIDDFDDDADEDWYDDDEPGEGDAAPCPECGKPVDFVADRCPACGYWILDADRRAMWSGMGKPMWMKVVAAIVLVAMVGAALLALF